MSLFNKQKKEEVKVPPVAPNTEEMVSDETDNAVIQDNATPEVAKPANNTQTSKADTEKKPVQNNEQAAFSRYAHVDFRKMSNEKLFNVIVELLRENKILAQEKAKLYDEVSQYNEEVKSVRKATGNVSDKIDYIAAKVCPELIKMINDGKKLSIDAKVSIIIDSILQEKRKYMTQILNLRETIKGHKMVLDELKAQLIEKTEVSNQEYESEKKEFTEKDFETFAGATASERTSDEFTSIQGSVAIKAIDLEKARDSIGPTEQKIMEAIGREGISEHPALLDYCLKSNTGITDTKFEIACDKLKSNLIVDMETVQSFNRIRGIRVYSLSNEVGKPLYKEIFREKPVVSEKEKIKRENDNLSHGYSIKDVKVQLEEFGYTDVSMDRKDNTIPIAGANTWVPDIIGTNPTTGRKEYFEIEMGTHNQTNFNAKMDKANLKASILRIVVPNKTVQDNICRKIDDWRALNIKKTSSITIFVQRFNEFKVKDDGRVFVPTDKVLAKDFIENRKNKDTAKENQNKDKQELNKKTNQNSSLEDDV